MYVGKVVRTHPTIGTIVYRIQNGYEIDELHDVAITSPTNGQILQYDSATSLWKNVTPSSGGLTVGTTAITSGTAGRVLFEDATNKLNESANFYWDNTNSRLSIGQGSSPGARLDIASPGALSTDLAFRVRNSANTQNSFQIDGLGQGRIKSTSYVPKFSIGYDWFGSDRDAFIFTQSVQNSRGQAWTFNAGYNGSFEGLEISNDLTGNDKGQFTIQLNNFCFGTRMLNSDTGTAERRVLRIANGVAPTTSKVDEFKFYSADIVTGNAAPHFRTEAGDIIKLYKETTAVSASTFVANASLIANDTATFDGYTIGQVVKALRNIGILA